MPVHSAEDDTSHRGGSISSSCFIMPLSLNASYAGLYQGGYGSRRSCMECSSIPPRSIIRKALRIFGRLRSLVRKLGLPVFVLREIAGYIPLKISSRARWKTFSGDFFGSWDVEKSDLGGVQSVKQSGG